jgi:hypothetical protein
MLKANSPTPRLIIPAASQRESASGDEDDPSRVARSITPGSNSQARWQAQRMDREFISGKEPSQTALAKRPFHENELPPAVAFTFAASVEFLTFERTHPWA